MGTDIWDDATDGVEPYWVTGEPGEGSPRHKSGPLSPNAEQTDPWCLDRSNDLIHEPTQADVEWKSFTPFNPTGYSYTTASLKLDRYDPPTPLSPGTYPILIIAHGGGWLRGCRWLLDEEAYSAAQDLASVGEKFIALSIDYRLACDPDGTYVNDPGEELFLMCGWHYTTVDPDTSQPKAAVHDIQDAVVWAKEHVNDGDCGNVCWDGERVYVAGGSSGGNLAMMAALFSTTDGDPNNRPTAVAAWSGFPELSNMSDPNHVYGCTNTQQHPFETNASGSCWDAVDNYLDPTLCPVDGDGPESTCHDSNNSSYYVLGSPWHYVGDDDKINIVPIFFANAGGPHAGSQPVSPSVPGSPFQASPELVALQANDDLTTALSNAGWDPGNYKECTVNTNLHGSAYLTVKPCNDGDSTSVWKRNLAFFLQFP